MKRTAKTLALWTGTFLCTVLGVAAAVFAYEASRWTGRLRGVEEAPQRILRVLLDKGFQAGYPQWRKGVAKPAAQPPTHRALFDWISVAASPHLNETHLEVRTLEKTGPEGASEIRAVFQLPPVDTRTLQQIVQKIERSHPDLFCKELQLKPSDEPYKYEVPRIVFSIYIPSGK